MVGSFLQSKGLSISLFKPTIDAVGGTYDPVGNLLDDNLASKLSGYSHVLGANDGYKSLNLSLEVDNLALDDWLDNGIGRHVEVYSPELGRIFAGFVNVVSANLGLLATKRGPLLDINNRASVLYTPIFDADEDPPIVGDTTITPLADDAVSQALYGILETILNAGQQLDDGTTDDAEQIRDTFLLENAYPESDDNTLTIGTVGSISLSLEIVGYYEWLKKFIYNDYTAGTITYNTKIETALATDPNGIFSTDYSLMDANASLASQYEENERTCHDVIMGLLPQGDAAYNRWLFGVGDNQRVFYNALPSTIEYEHSMLDPMQRLNLYGQGPQVELWNMKAGQWLFVKDYLIGRSTSSILRRDPRNMFIESVTYNAPNGITLTGNKVSTLDQLIARKGTGGLTA